MGILTDFYAAPRASAEKILAGKAAKLPKVTSKGIDEVKLTSLDAIARKQLSAKGKPGEATLLTDQDAEQWVFLVSPALVALLARAGAKAGAIAKAWAATEEMKRDGWSPAETKELVDQLVALAATATKTKVDMLLWMSL